MIQKQTVLLVFEWAAESGYKHKAVQVLAQRFLLIFWLLQLYCVPQMLLLLFAYYLEKCYVLIAGTVCPQSQSRDSFPFFTSANPIYIWTNTFFFFNIKINILKSLFSLHVYILRSAPSVFWKSGSGLLILILPPPTPTLQPGDQLLSAKHPTKRGRQGGRDVDEGRQESSCLPCCLWAACWVEVTAAGQVRVKKIF